MGYLDNAEMMDMRLGYCTKHGSTTECLQCTIDELRSQLQHAVISTAEECVTIVRRKMISPCCEDCRDPVVLCGECIMSEMRERFNLEIT